MSNAFRAGMALLAAGLCAGLMSLPRRSDSQEGPAVKLTDYPEITPRGYVCHRADKAPDLDGKLGDPSWEAVPWSDDFVDIEGDKKPRPRQRTRMKMLWDDECLYIAAQLDETHVWGTLTKHDSVIFQDNDFEVFLDPDSDSHLYAEMEMNALNTTWDLLLTRPYKDGGKAIDAWEIPGLRTAVHIDGSLNDPRGADKGWSVEIAWPWNSLKELSQGKVQGGAVPPRDGDQWRVNFSRVQWQHEIVDGKYRKVKGKAEDNWVWSPQGVIDMHRPERWGIVQFSAAKPGAAPYRPDPSADVRHLLHRVLYAQRDHHKAKGRWAPRLGDLGLADAKFGAVLLETTSTRFEASAPAGDGTQRRWRIGSDARVWRE